MEIHGFTVLQNEITVGIHHMGTGIGGGGVDCVGGIHQHTGVCGAVTGHIILLSDKANMLALDRCRQELEIAKVNVTGLIVTEAQELDTGFIKAGTHIQFAQVQSHRNPLATGGIGGAIGLTGQERAVAAKGMGITGSEGFSH